MVLKIAVDGKRRELGLGIIASTSHSQIGHGLTAPETTKAPPSPARPFIW
jgi:hypothetical protein